MSTIIVSGALRDQLLASKGEAEFRDEAGHLIGRFISSEYDELDLDMTEEEIARLTSPDVKTYSTAEVLAYLKGLTP